MKARKILEAMTKAEVLRLMPSEYIIHSPSERGFWNNEEGWVSSTDDATTFTAQEREQFENSLPMSVGNDARWIFRPVESYSYW